MGREDRDTRTTRRDLFRGSATIVALSTIVAGCSDRGTRSHSAHHDEDTPPPTNPALVKYREKARLPITVPDPRGIAWDGAGSIWVVGNGEMQRSPIEGPSSVAETIRYDGPGTCVAFDHERLLVGVEGKVLQVAASSRQPRVWLDVGPGAVITCIAVGKDAIYLADAGHRRIVRCTLDGKIRGYLCEKDEKRGYNGLIVPSPHLDVCVDADGAVHVANPGSHRIEIYDSDGAPRWSWGEESQDMPGFCGCCNPTDFALLPDGRYVTTEKGIPRIKIYSPEGHFECVVAGPEHLSPGVVGVDVAVLADGVIAALDRGIGAVRLFARSEGG